MLIDFFGATAPYDNVGGRINRGLGQRLMGAGRVQYAALPYQKTAEGLQTLLITSRETRRWIAPKGWPTRSKASAVRWNVASQIAWGGRHAGRGDCWRPCL